MGLIINEVPAPPGSPVGVTYQVTNLTQNEATVILAPVIQEKVIVQGTANYAPPGPKGDPGIYVGSNPPPDNDTLWVKI